jgi:pimeloyl-ACP methyl ester carboxylesterase
MMCDASLWSNQVAALGAHWHVSVGDITGADSVGEIAAQVLAAAPRSVAVAGLSMGGIVALEMWRQAPERIERLALLDSNFRADPPERQRLRDRQVADVAAGSLARVLREELKPNYLADCHRGNTALLDEVLGMGMALGADVFRRQSLALRNRPDSSTTLATITCPVLVLCGDEDRLCPPALHREMAALIPNAALDIVPRCGHLSTLERPNAVSAALRRWLTYNKE